MRRIILAAVIMAAALAAAGCIFEPRTADEPLSEGDPWVVPILPKSIFYNIQTGFSSAANSNYERSLAEEFVFIARPQDWPDAPAWGKTEELDFLTRVKGEYPAAREILFGDENMTFERENVDVGRAEYEGLYVITLDPGGRGTGRDICGEGDFHRREGGDRVGARELGGRRYLRDIFHIDISKKDIAMICPRQGA